MFSKEVADLAVEVPGLGDGTVGWTAESAKRAIRSLEGKVAIARIDVFDRVQWGFAPAPESWQCFHLRNERATDFAIRSRAEALSWLDAIPRREVLFVIDFSFQDEAAEATGSFSFEPDDAG